MSTKMIVPCTLVLTILGVCAVRAQDISTGPGVFEGPRSPVPTYQDSAPPASQEPGPPAAGPTPARLSKWLSYTKPECCGPIGGDGPIFYELYLRTGFEIPAEGKIFGHVLETGWQVQGGGRSLFFKPSMDRAWAVDLGIGNIFNRSQRSDIKVPLRILVPAAGPVPAAGTPVLVNRQVSIRQLNRTYVEPSFGHEWYLTTPQDRLWYKWRVGLDVGGQLGSAKAEFNEIQHRQDVYGAVVLALHTDWEFSWSCCTFMAGFRAEWAYNWMDILQERNDSDLQDVSLLFTAGVRF